MNTIDHKNLAEALLAFQAEAPALPKDGRNPHFNSRFTKLDTIREKIGPLLVKHGLTWQTFPCFGPSSEPAMRYTLTHANGDSQSEVMPLMLSKATAQELGSALTYARRYSVTAVLDLVADDDDDGTRASQTSSQASSGQSNGSGDQTLGANLASPEDRDELITAAKGLTAKQIRLVLASQGVRAPSDIARAFDAIPAVKSASLVRALVAVERDS